MEVLFTNNVTIEINKEKFIFDYVQDLIPICKNGSLYIYNHNDNVKYKDSPKNRYGKRDYCKFKFNYPAKVSGVYLWIVENQIIYIGETNDLSKRFSSIGYGSISPRNCTANGQTTNCKMNGVVLDLFRKNKIVHLYFLPTCNYKEIELKLLNNLTTKYNSKNN